MTNSLPSTLTGILVYENPTYKVYRHIGRQQEFTIWKGVHVEKFCSGSEMSRVYSFGYKASKEL